MRYITKITYMQENYIVEQRIIYRVSLALAYSKSIQVVKSKMLKEKIVLINN